MHIDCRTAALRIEETGNPSGAKSDPSTERHQGMCAQTLDHTSSSDNSD